MDNKKEDKLNQTLKHPTDNHSEEIAKLIDYTLRNKHNVYCCTDWHLWIRKEKGRKECHKRKEFEEIIKNVNDTMTKDDLLINLGDLVDGEFENKEELKSILKTLPGKKILIIGNNDLFTNLFYKSCGFDYVIQSFVWNDVVFSHMPIKNDNEINVHGHIHDSHTYWIPYKNHIDVAALGGRIRLVELDKVIKTQPSYARTIKESPGHFNEGYFVCCGNLFEKVMMEYSIIPDPFPDVE